MSLKKKKGMNQEINTKKKKKQTHHKSHIITTTTTAMEKQFNTNQHTQKHKHTPTLKHQHKPTINKLKNTPKTSNSTQKKTLYLITSKLQIDLFVYVNNCGHNVS